MLGKTAAFSMARPEKSEESTGFIYNSKQRCLLQKPQVYLHHLAHHKSLVVNIYHLIVSRADVLQISL